MCLLTIEGDPLRRDGGTWAAPGHSSFWLLTLEIENPGAGRGMLISLAVVLLDRYHRGALKQSTSLEVEQFGSVSWEWTGTLDQWGSHRGLQGPAHMDFAAWSEFRRSRFFSVVRSKVLMFCEFYFVHSFCQQLKLLSYLTSTSRRYQVVLWNRMDRD